MRRSLIGFGVAAMFAAASAGAAAQGAVTVRGTVTGDNAPLAAVTVQVSEIPSVAGGTTDANGRYSFIIPSSQVRGQTVTLVARHRRFLEGTATVVLVGASISQDFALTPVPRPTAGGGGGGATPGVPGAGAPLPADVSSALAALTVPEAGRVNNRALDQTAGATDLMSALAGRIPGFLVTSAAIPGGSTPAYFRGVRSLWGRTAPLVVLDGVPLESSIFTLTGQPFAQGGLDYGNPLQDILVHNVKSARLVSGGAAALQYGARAGNGVLLVESETGRGFSDIEVAAHQQFTRERFLRLPEFQNAFGQGSNGVFEFLDGRGGGINDGVAESWGPALSGQPLAQASLTEVGRPDVRFWLPRPDAVRGYFDDATSRTSVVAGRWGGDNGSIRASLHDQAFSGVTPGFALVRRGVSLSGNRTHNNKLHFRGSLTIGYLSANSRPGTGLDGTNPISEFLVVGRQVDLDTLRGRILDASRNQFNWIYTGRNNPFFEPELNLNEDHRLTVTGGLSLRYALSSANALELSVGGDGRAESREMAVAPGWLGDYPAYAARTAATFGLAHHHEITTRDPYGRLALTFAPPSASQWKLNGRVAADIHRASTHSTVDARKASGASGGLERVAELSTDESASWGSQSLTAELHASPSAWLTLMGGARSEWLSGDESPGGTALLPSAGVTIDFVRGLPALRSKRRFSVFQLSGEWWKSGNDLGPRALRTIYVPAGSPPAPGLSQRMETTAGLQATLTVVSPSDRMGLDHTHYSERSTDVLFAVATTGATSEVVQGGEIENAGNEVRVWAAPMRGAIDWIVAASYSRNRNSVLSLPSGAGTITMGPAYFGTTLEARTGEPIGVLTGRGFLRDDSGARLLRGGLPLPTSEPRVFGSWQPTSMWSLGSELRVRGFDAAILVESRMGGKIFSGTNRLGSTAGTLTLTADRPDSGLLVSGIDADTRAPNTTHVSAEQYFHALGDIQEAWVYDGAFVKLRELRAGYALPLDRLPYLSDQAVRITLIGRNLWLKSKVPNIDPETAFAGGTFQGMEMGQLPTTKSFGIQLSILP